MTATPEMPLSPTAAAGPASPVDGPPSPGPRAGFELPFDPWRLVAAVLRNWLWLALGGGLLATAAGAAAYFRIQPQFIASAQLMRQEAAGTFRASELGEPFKPRQLSVPTLVSFMKSPAVLQRVSEQSQPRLSPRAILGGLTIVPERNTDLITVSFRSERSDQAAMRLLNLFGAEVVRLTRDLQGQEAAEVNRLLRKQVAKNEDDLQQINRELLAFSQDAGLVNVDKEMDAYLRKLGELDLRFESTRIDYETLDLKIGALEQELAQNNPLADRAQAARERLAALRAQYTDANPLVEEQLERVDAIEKEVERAAGKPVAPPRQGESSLAASFYQELVTLKTQKEVLAAQLEKLKESRTTAEDRLRGLPEKGMQYARIKARQQSLETAQSLLVSRQREAQLYEENPLGYYRFFESKPDQVEVIGRSKKVILFAVAGGLLGVLLGVALVGLVESLDDRIKTLADVKRVTKLPLLARLADLESLDAVEQANWAFRTWLALQARLTGRPDRGLVCGFAASSTGEGCSTWIELLGHAAGLRGLHVLIVTNSAPRNGLTHDLDDALATPSTVRVEAGSPAWLLAPKQWCWDASRRRQWAAALHQWQQTPGLVVLVELTAVEQPDTLLMAESLPQVIWLVGRDQAKARATTERLDLLRHAGCQFAGAVLNRHRRLFPWVPTNL